MNQPLLGRTLLAVLAVVPAACLNSSGGGGLPSTGVTADTHKWFPIAAANTHAIGRVMPDGTMACQSCHAATNTSFKEFNCVGCHDHEQTITDRLHLARPNEYKYASDSCYSCHTNGKPVGFSHFGVTDTCAQCHDIGTQFAALPKAGLDHPDTGGADCAGCHDTSSWKGATGGAPRNSHDPAQDIALDALIPTYAGLSISTLSPETETLPQVMNHGTSAVDATVLSTCTNCHLDAASGIYYPGQFHASLAVLMLPQPTTCIDCHKPSMPSGFVGAIKSDRTPPSGEMKHDAVAWNGGAPGMTSAVTVECGLCHQAPGRNRSSWSIGAAGASPALMHPALTSAGAPQPVSCIDCHANSRPCPSGDCSLPITSATAPSLPANVQFDHQSPEALADCSRCHGSTAATQGATWAGGKFHQAGSASPKTCLPCHTNERPASTSGWLSTTYTQSPFDYGTSANGITHGDGQDCASCHGGPGTGAWGGSQNWAGARFPHGAATVAGTTCIACHSSQRPTALVMSFDHAANGSGDCFGCHQATVTAGVFVNYTNPSTGTLPGGDWKGGQQYPGPSLASSGSAFIAVTALQLHRSVPSNLVTGATSSVENLYNGIVHTSSVIDARLSPGPATATDNTKCWHCHTNTNGTVTTYNGGKYHASLTGYAATPGGAVTVIAQPTSRCADCHAQMLPVGIVENAASDLQAMDHGAELAAAATIGGVSVTKVSQIDCSICHKSPGRTWADGRFHASIVGGAPKDCISCHYPLMADGARADLTSGVAYAMKHRSGQITFQTCETCHTGALTKATTTPAAAVAWSPGAFHPSVASQPTACIDCHAASDPAANAPTKSSVTYALALGATASNTGQWMNHGSIYVAGKDCVACHAADAKSSGSAWSKTSSFHAKIGGVTTCNVCHGLSNGGGATAGTNNNLPAGLTNSTMVTSAAKNAATGVAAGTFDQINHADVNVTAHDCSFCHGQIGPSTASGIQGQEWAQAKFHQSFNAANPLVANGTTGRCSSCHLNVKPGASYTGQSHAAFTSVSGSTDCGSCHSWPGTGGATSPNWLGASGGVPTVISVGGFTISKPPAANTTTTQQGITNLPHPTAGTQACITCHTTAGGGRNAYGYDHSSALNNANCNACHEAGSDLVNPVWNGSASQASGAGDTRPFTIASLKATKGGSCTVTYPNHFYPADCSACHNEPSGAVTTKTGSAFTSAWVFNHNQSKMKGLCSECHGPCPGD